jgi:winged helix DNA-binding protein
MRSTIHLVTAADALALRPLVQPVLDRDLRTNATHGPPLRGLDAAEVAVAGRELLAQAPRTPAELGALLARRWPDRPPAALAYAVRNLVGLVQVPPRGLWGRSGATRHATVEDWLGQQPTAPDPKAVVRRYLAAFGPASVADLQTWSGLTRLAGVVDDLRPGLVALRDDGGRELLDLPDAPRPDPDAPSPPRLLGQFDDVFLAHADRRRIIPGGRTFARLTREHGLRRPRGAAVVSGTLLVDGYLDGTWRVGAAGGAATLRVAPFRRLTAAEADAVGEEAARLLDVVVPDAGTRRVEVAPPQ